MNAPVVDEARRNGERHVVVVVGNPQPASRTAAAATLLGERVGELVAAPEVTLIDLTTLGPALMAWGDESVAAAKSTVLDATVLVVASPTYKAAYTGLLKLFLDQFERGQLAPVPAVVPLMTGAGRQHALAVEVHLRPVLLEIGATCPTAGLFLADEQVDEPGPAIDEWWVGAAGPLRRAAGT
jgi:FMN reductase